MYSLVSVVSVVSVSLPAGDRLIQECTVPGVGLGVRLDGHQAEGVVLYSARHLHRLE